MLRTQAAAGQQQTYNEAVRHTLQSLAVVDDATLVGLTRLGIAEIEALKHEVAEILPAGNLPAFLLQGLVQLKDRTLKPERVAADLRLLFQATKQIGIFGTFLAAPALALRGYQKLLALAGKDVESAFPDGPWQFYTEFGLREDTARHCAETVGFHRVASTVSEVDNLTAWAYAALQTIFGYDELLANEWDERMLLRTLDTLLDTHARAELATDTVPETVEHSQQLVKAVTRLRSTYGIDRLAAGWAAIRPYRLPAETPLDDYAAFRRARFRAYLDQALSQLPSQIRTELDTHFLALRTADLPAYQRQMTLLMTLDAENYQDHRTPLPLYQACIALVVGGRYYLIDACARNGNRDLFIYPLDGSERNGTRLPLRETSDGTLQDTYSRPVTIDRRSRVKIGNVAVGRLRPPSLESVKQQVAAILAYTTAGNADNTSNGEIPTDMLLAQAPRERQAALRRLLDAPTQSELGALRSAPIIINWDVHDGYLPLTMLRRTHRGVGDHALTIIRTDRSMVFDLSHIFFDGGWGMALAEIVTNLATDLAVPTAHIRNSAVTTASPLRLAATSAFLLAARDAVARSPAEAAAETTAIDLPAMTKLRQRLARRQLPLTVNDLLLLARCMHATSYRPGPMAQRALGIIATLPDGQQLVPEIMAHLDQQRKINPSLLIPMDASAVDPRLRLYPATFRNPLPELIIRLDRCNIAVTRLKQQPDPATQALFERERSALFGELYNFGATLQALKQVTMRGESFTTAALRLLGHLPQPMQYLLDLIPQKIGILNEILKGREVFSNVGQVAATSSLTRFASARDDGETKLLIWGVMSDATGRLAVSLRDFRPHVAPLLKGGRGDLADILAQDYLDDYAAGVNALVRRLQRVLSYIEP
jgi:hypothetical protein